MAPAVSGLFTPSLCFTSSHKAKYPIYDKYAHIALLRLQDPKPFFSEESLVTDKAHNEEFHSRTGNMGTRWEDYCKNYVEPLKSLFIFESVYRKTGGWIVLCGRMVICSMRPRPTKRG